MSNCYDSAGFLTSKSAAAAWKDLYPPKLIKA
jgi:hypothetical protein